MNAHTASTTQAQNVVPRVAKSDSRLSRNHPGLLASLGLAALLLVSAPALAQTLGSAQSFAILGGSAVSANGTGSVITGDVGVSPGTAISGFPAQATVVPPFSTHANDGPAIAAQTSVTALYVALTPGACATPSLPQLSGATFTPGTYCFSSTADLATTGVLTLNGAGTYIFQVGSSLTANTLSTVNLINGADPCNVFWQVTGAATLNGINFAGNIVAQAAVDLGVGAILTGRALTTSLGAVTLAGGNTAGGCSFAGPGLATPTLGNPLPLPSVPLGTPISDTKMLSNAVIPTGTITFQLFGPNDATCTGPVIFTSTVTVNGNGIYSSPSFTPLVIGTYRWIANYSGDANNVPTANACNAPNENVVVLAAGDFGIPTLSEWALILLAMLMAGAGITAMRKRKS